MADEQKMTIDRALLRRQAVCLAEIQAFLTAGDTSPHADEWFEALEGVLNLLAALDQEARA